jgi:hypothetical protein
MRFVNRVLAAVVALALVVAGVLIVVEVIAARFSAGTVVVHWRVALRWARRTTWDTSVVQSTCILMAVVGLILVLLELKPRRRRRFKVRSDASDAAFTRRGVKTAVQTAVDDVDGVGSAAVKVRRRRIRVRATATAAASHTAASLDDSVRAAAQGRVDSLALDPAPRIVTHVGTRSS